MLLPTLFYGYYFFNKDFRYLPRALCKLTMNYPGKLL